jgi:iron-sulfur cluster assembly protein
MSRKAVITVTENAALQVQNLLNKRGKTSLGIRIGVRSGGCSGMKYFVEYADVKQPFDEVVNDHGVTILIDPKALIYLLGAEMDYVEEDFKSGFTFTNPNAKAKCGCGTSFNV